jgi:lysozyme family protein
LGEDEVRQIYRERYWEAGHCGELPVALGIIHFDWCVNQGIRGAVATLQEAVGAAVDGEWGPGTAVAAAGIDDGISSRYEELRRQWYRQRVAQRPDQRGFLKGWLGRVDRLDAFAAGLK